MVFKMISNVEFVAENIDDAFMILSNHFKNLIDLESSDHENISPFIKGSIKINRSENKGNLIQTSMVPCSGWAIGEGCGDNPCMLH